MTYSESIITPAVTKCHMCYYQYSFVLFIIQCNWIYFLPAGCLQEVPEELLVTRERWRRAGADDSLRLNETLLEALQTPQTVSSQHA